MDEERPRYKLIGHFHSPEMGLLSAGAVIEFDGEPNLYMEPLNDTAKKAMDAFRSKIESLPKRSINLVTQ